MRPLDYLYRCVAFVAGSQTVLWTVQATGKIIGRLKRQTIKDSVTIQKADEEI